MLMTPLKRLQPHPAQMRTTYDLDNLAALALQIHSRGLDSWQPFVAAGLDGDGEAQIISGHRRHMARLIACALEAWCGENPAESRRPLSRRGRSWASWWPPTAPWGRRWPN